MEQKDLTGQKFGRWTAIERVRVYNGRWRTKWRCVCDCGNEKLVSQDHLVEGTSLSCGCLAREVNSKLRSKNYELVGKKFGRWTVLERVDREIGDTHHTKWLCECDCGTIRQVTQDALLSGNSQSCGCRLGEISVKIHTKHDESYTQLWNVWSGMKSRCYNPNSQCYKDYGARGIRVCDKWLNDYKAFSDWAHANGYVEGLTIDRIDVNGNYEPDNCRWADRITQCNNKRTNVRIEWNGETHTLAEWCRILNLPYKKTHARYRYYGWEPDELFTTA